MPVQSGKSPVADALKRAGLQKNFNAHKGDETKLSAGGELPAGIEGGIAQLVEAKIGLVAKEGPNKGKPFFYVAGVVKEPAAYAGRRTDRSFMLFGEQDAIDKAIADSLNEMRKLGIETAGLELDDWEAALEALKQEGPHFRFRTWAFGKDEIVERAGKWYVVQDGKDRGGPYASEAALKKAKPYAGREPRVNHDWRGLATGFVSGEANHEGAVDDNSGSEPADASPADSGDVDYLALGSAADSGDAAAANNLLAKAEELGIKEDVEGAKSWEAGAQLIVDAMGGGGDSGGEDTSSSEPFEPVKGNVYSLKAKGAKKFEDYECTAVFKTTVNLKRLTDDKVFTKVEWTADPPQIWGQDVEA